MGTLKPGLNSITLPDPEKIYRVTVKYGLPGSTARTIASAVIHPAGGLPAILASGQLEYSAEYSGKDPSITISECRLTFQTPPEEELVVGSLYFTIRYINQEGTVIRKDRREAAKIKTLPGQKEAAVSTRTQKLWLKGSRPGKGVSLHITGEVNYEEKYSLKPILKPKGL